MRRMITRMPKARPRKIPTMRKSGLRSKRASSHFPPQTPSKRKRVKSMPIALTSPMARHGFWSLFGVFISLTPGSARFCSKQLFLLKLVYYYLVSDKSNSCMNSKKLPAPMGSVKFFFKSRLSYNSTGDLSIKVIISPLIFLYFPSTHRSLQSRRLPHHGSHSVWG